MISMKDASLNRAIDVWKTSSTLFEGASSSIKLVENQETCRYSVAKISKRKSAAEQLETEAGIHKGLQHPRVLRFEQFQRELTIVDSEENSRTVTAILIEYAPKGDLFELLCHFDQMPLILARSYARQMAEAVAYIQEEGIAHRDIKLENFLLDSNFNIKLADFGASCRTDKDQKHSEKVGTFSYLAPEQQKNESYNGFEVDVFSLGVTIFTLVSGRMPFNEASQDDEYYVNFVNKRPAIFWGMHEELTESVARMPFFSEGFREVINGMLCYDATQRMTIKEVINHAWLDVKPQNIELCSGMVAEFFKKKRVAC